MDLREFLPEDVEHFKLVVTASIGPAGEEGEELFHFVVCSPSWVAGESLPKGFEFGGTPCSSSAGIPIWWSGQSPICVGVRGATAGKTLLRASRATATGSSRTRE